MAEKITVWPIARFA